MNAGREKIPI